MKFFNFKILLGVFLFLYEYVISEFELYWLVIVFLISGYFKWLLIILEEKKILYEYMCGYYLLMEMCLVRWWLY